jgi:SH3 domain protein
MIKKHPEVLALICGALAAVSCSLQVQGAASVGALDHANTPQTQALDALERSPTLAPTLARVSAIRSLNVRAYPGYKERIIGALYAGNVVTLTRSCWNGWAEISWDLGSAWVNSKYLSDNLCRRQSDDKTNEQKTISTNLPK